MNYEYINKNNVIRFKPYYILSDEDPLFESFIDNLQNEFVPRLHS